MKKTVLTPWCHENSAVPVTHAELDSVVSMHRLIRRDRPSKHCVFIKEVTKIPVLAKVTIFRRRSTLSVYLTLLVHVSMTRRIENNLNIVEKYLQNLEPLHKTVLRSRSRSQWSRNYLRRGTRSQSRNLFNEYLLQSVWRMLGCRKTSSYGTTVIILF